MPPSPLLPPARPMLLTPRQAEVARLVAYGEPYKRIATLLAISPDTVQNTIEEIGRRLVAPDYPQLTPRARCTAWVYTVDQPDRRAVPRAPAA